jgi:hypothetical protein
LLRAVGHVLKSVDAKASAEAKRAIDAEWRDLEEHKAKYPIFWKFILNERNNVVKEYRFAAGQDVTVSLGGDPTIYAYPMKHGYFAGRDQREVIAEAIRFWGAHLDRVDARIGSPSRGPAGACGTAERSGFGWPSAPQLAAFPREEENDSRGEATSR